MHTFVTRAWLAALALLALGVWAPSAGAISNGSHDTAHPMVGLLVGSYDPDGDGPLAAAPRFICSGGMISPTIFVTAGHCVAELENQGITHEQAGITFAGNVGFVWDTAPPIITGSFLAVDSWAVYPGYRGPNLNKAYGDVGIVRLVSPVGVGTLRLPGEDWYLNSLTLKDRTFTMVGYGVGEIYDKTWWLGPPDHVFFDGYRNAGEAPYRSLTADYVKLTSSTVLYPDVSRVGPGDSGAPFFVTAGGHQVAVAVGSGSGYHNLSEGQRLDTPSIREWLADEIAD